MISEETRAYYDLKKRNDVRESAKRIRRQFLRYPKNLWSEIIGNCDIQLMMGCSDDVSAEFFSVRSGDMYVQVKSTMTVRQTLALAQVIPQYRSMEGHGRRRLS